MSTFLTIRQAAERLGVSMDTLRQWERDGRLTARRTQGGHRRFPVEEIERLIGRRSKPARPASATPGLPAQTVPIAAVPRRGGPPVGKHLDPFWQGQLKDARARTEIGRLRREALEQRTEFDRRRALHLQAEAATKRREEHREQLRELKAFGRSIVPAAIGAEGRAEITSDLEVFVTAERFSLELPPADARVLVQARVSAALARIEQLRAAAASREEQERRRAACQRQLEWLTAAGLRAARRNTWSWQAVDQLRALRDVEEQLRDEVRSDWSYAQVEALVTEILSEFEECDEDGEAADSVDDEEGEDDED